MKAIIAIIVFSLLLFGCLGVDQGAYDKVKTERDAYETQAKDATARISALDAQCSSAQSSLIKCTSDLDVLTRQCGQSGTSCDNLKISYDSLAAKIALVRGNISALMPYRNAMALYFEVIKSGKVPGYSRLVAADDAVNATGDSELVALWKSARDCPRRGGDCTKAYVPFESYLDAKIDAYVASIIASANS